MDKKYIELEAALEAVSFYDEDKIRAIPAADVVLVRHGRWIKPTRVSDSMLDECSLCGFGCGAYTFNYCPNCGARMDGDEE